MYDDQDDLDSPTISDLPDSHFSLSRSKVIRRTIIGTSILLLVLLIMLLTPTLNLFVTDHFASQTPQQPANKNAYFDTHPNLSSKGIGTNIIIANGVLYAWTNEQKVLAESLINGHILWQQHMDGSILLAPQIVNNHLLIVEGMSSTTSALLALDTTDGYVLWRYNITGQPLKPFPVRNNILYVVSAHNLVALRDSDGHQIWNITVSNDDNLDFEHQADLIGNILYVNSYYMAYAVQADNGKPLWQANGQILSAGGNLVYLQRNDTSNSTASQASNIVIIQALNARTGSQVWEQTLGEGNISLMEASNDLTYVEVTNFVQLISQTTTSSKNLQHTFQASNPEGSTTLYALGASNGRILWSVPLDHQQYQTGSWLLIDQNIVYTNAVSVNKSPFYHIYAFNTQNGSLLWNYASSKQPSQALLANGQLYVTSLDKQAIALDSSNGHLLWSFQADSAVTSPPTVDATNVYISTDNGTLIALDALSGHEIWQHKAN